MRRFVALLRGLPSFADLLPRPEPVPLPRAEVRPPIRKATPLEAMQMLMRGRDA